MKPSTSVSQMEKIFTASSAPSMAWRSLSKRVLEEVRERVLSLSPGNRAAAPRAETGQRRRLPALTSAAEKKRGRKNFQNADNFLPSSSAPPRSSGLTLSPRRLRPAPKPPQRTRPRSTRKKKGARASDGAQRRGQGARVQPGTRPTLCLISSGWRSRQLSGDSQRTSGSEDPRQHTAPQHRPRRNWRQAQDCAGGWPRSAARRPISARCPRPPSSATQPGASSGDLL